MTPRALSKHGVAQVSEEPARAAVQPLRERPVSSERASDEDREKAMDNMKGVRLGLTSALKDLLSVHPLFPPRSQQDSQRRSIAMHALVEPLTLPSIQIIRDTQPLDGACCPALPGVVIWHTEGALGLTAGLGGSASGGNSSSPKLTSPTESEGGRHLRLISNFMYIVCRAYPTARSPTPGMVMCSAGSSTD